MLRACAVPPAGEEPAGMDGTMSPKATRLLSFGGDDICTLVPQILQMPAHVPGLSARQVLQRLQGAGGLGSGLGHNRR